jgi:hypothetical protein
MRRIIRKYERWLENGDRVIVDILKVDSPKYRDGIIYTFRCMGKDGQTVFAIENSHGRPHIHRKGGKEDVDCDWKTAYLKFEEMVDERDKRIKEGKAW